MDLATRLDGDLKSASIQLGKALNDPIANLSALSRSGIQFSEDQKQVIKSLTESGRLAEAQTVILDELEKQYGGSAEAAAKAGTGGLKQLANSFGDLQEEFGKIIMEFLPPVIDGLKNMLKAFQGLSPQAKRFMVIGAGIAAALGPLLVIMPLIIQGVLALAGVIASVFTSAIAGASTAMAFLVTPIGAVIGVIALLVGAILVFSEEASKPIADVINFFIKLYNEIDFVRVMVGAVKGVVQTVFDFFIFAVDSVIASFKDLGRVITAFLSGNFNEIPTIIGEAFAGAAERMKEFGEKAGKNIQEGIDSELQRNPYELVTSDQVLDGINKVKGFADQAKDFIAGIFSGGGAGATVTPTPTETVTVQADLEFEDIEFIDDADLDEEDIDKVIERTNLVKNQINSIAGSMANFIDSTFKSIIAGTATFEEVMRDMIKQMLIQLASLIAQFAILSVLMPGSSLLKGGLGKFIGGGFGIPQMASGGIVSGPVIAQVGEYAGAQHNPEVIAPLDKLQAMMGGQSVQVTGKISGRDILLTSERNAIDRNRVRGF